MTEVDTGLQKVEALCDLIVEWGRSMLGDNLEGVRFVMRQLQGAGQAWPRYHAQTTKCIQHLQEHVVAHYGAKIMLH